MPYHNRHGRPPRGAPSITRYGREAYEEYTETPLQVDKEDEARLEALKQRVKQSGLGALDQVDRELWDDILARKEDRMDMRSRPLAREIEGYFEHLHLPAFPPPLPKSSLWLGFMRSRFYKPENIRPFYVACEEGRLDEVKRWMIQKKDALGVMGLRDGLDCAAIGDQFNVAQYFLKEVGVPIHAHAVRAACDNRSLPLLQLFLQHGYHPNQQVPSNAGHFGTSLWHCLDNDAISCLLLENGADPNVAPIMVGKRGLWSERAVVPMDRTSGLPLDIAVEKSSLKVIRKLLECGANPRYSRPLGRVLRDRPAYMAAHPGMEDDWRCVMQLCIDHGADVNARTWAGGTALMTAVRMDRWDAVEFLLERGADPRKQRLDRKEDSFAVAAQVAGTLWEESAELLAYLDHLCRSGDGEGADIRAPSGVEENPLVRFMVARRAKGSE